MSKEGKQEALTFVRKELEKQLAGATFSDEENLVQYGLSSIMVMQISSRLRKFGLRIPFAKLFEKPTMAAWKSLIDAAEVKAIRKNQEKGSHDRPFRLTDVQYAYYAGRDSERILGKVSCHAYMEFDGQALDPERLEAAWNLVQQKHAMLRVKFTEDGMQQFLEAPYSKEITVFDCRQSTEFAVEEQIQRIRKERSHRKLKVELGQVAALALLQLPSQRSKMIFDVDLLVADVASIGIILDDLARAYEQNHLEASSAYNFRNYLTEHLLLDSKKRQEDLEYWKEKIEQMPEFTPQLHLKTDPEKIATQKFERMQRNLDKESWEKIKKISAGYGVTPSMVLLSAYCLVLERWCNQESFFVNLPLFNRNLEEEKVEGMVADFTNLLLVDFYRKKEEVFRDTVSRIKKRFLENMSHNACSGVEVQRMVQKKNGTMGLVAPVVFACNLDASIETENSRRVFSDMSYMISQTPQVWLDFQMYEKDGMLQICWDYVKELFEKSMLEAMQKALFDLLVALTEEQNWMRVIDLLPEKEKAFYEREQKAVEAHLIPEKTLLTNFLEMVEKNPEKIALIDTVTDEKVSYQKLYQKAAGVASYLKNQGVSEGEYVVVKVPRSLEQVFACLGVLMTGACYIPLGVHQPKERIRQLEKQIPISCMIDDYGKIEAYSKAYKEEMEAFRPYDNHPSDSAYIIMTSGSTGVPKCVEISHQSAINTIEEVNRLAKTDSHTVELMVAAYDFDLSVYDFFGILGQGGTLIILEEDSAKNPERWAECIENYGVNFWNSTPMAFDMCVTYFESMGKTLGVKTALLSGDWIPLDLPGRFRKLQKKGQVIAMGGATEAAIWSNYLLVPEKIPGNWKSIPYGKPLEGQTYRVMDDLERPCPFYVKGELWIGGQGVAKGYKGDADLTQKKFISEEIPWYRTGDQGMIWEDENIEFLGRKDHQVKIKGYRIEIGEVESALNRISYLKNAVVAVIEEHRGKRLAALIVVEDQAQFEEEKLKKELEEYLPAYMIPDLLRLSDEIPQTGNGKPDRKKIQQMLEEALSFEHVEAVEGEIEKAIYKIWSEVLERKEISREDNYFSLGGDSLKAVTIVARLKKEVDSNIKWTTNLLYKAPTIRELGKIVEDSMEEMEEDVI